MGNEAITPQGLQQSKKESNTKSNPINKPPNKWARRKGERKGNNKEEKLVVELWKRQFVEVTISEVEPMDLCGVE